MIEKGQLGKIAEAFVENVDCESGIKLDEAGLCFCDNGDTLSLNIGDTFIAKCEYEDEFEAEDLAFELFEAVEDIKGLLTQAKIAELEPHVSTHYPEIREALTEHLSKEKIDDLQFELKATTRFGNHYEMDEELDHGYPPVVLCITDYDEIEFWQELNIYCPEDALDLDELRNSLVRYFADDQ